MSTDKDKSISEETKVKKPSAKTAEKTSSDKTNSDKKDSGKMSSKKMNSKKVNSGKKKADAVLPGTDRNYIRTIRILAFLIPVAAVLLGMLAGSFAPFGGKDVMTSGGATQHLTYYYELYDRVHAGEGFFYSLDYGHDFSTIFTYYLSDPLNLLILIFPRTAILTVINLLYALKIGLAGLFMSIFLTRRKARILARREAMEALRADDIEELTEKARRKKELAREKAEARGGKVKKDFRLGGSEEPASAFGRLLSGLDLPNLGFSTAFALSAYMVGQGLDVSHLSVVALFPLLLMALDDLLENGKWKLYAALMTVSVFCSFYMAIIVFIFSVIYTAAYDYSDPYHALRNILLKLVSDILAAGAGMVIILNSVTSSFFSNEISRKFPHGNSTTTFFDAFKALLPGTGASKTLYYSYGIDIFCGILAVFLLLLYLGNPNISLRRKISQSIILACLTAALFLVTPNYLFNGFFASELNICVFGFLFVIQLLTMAYEALLNLDHNPLWQILTATVVLAALILASLFFADNYDVVRPFLLGMEFLFIYFVLTAMYRSNSMTRLLLFTLLPLLLMGEVLFTYVDNLREIGSESEKFEATRDGKMYEVSRGIREAVPGAHILIYDPADSMSDPVTNALLGYDIVLAIDDPDFPVDTGLEEITKIDGITIYKNPASLKGFILPKKVETWDYDRSAPLSSLNRLATDVLDLQDLYTPAYGEFNVGYSLVFDELMNEDPRNISYGYFYDLDAVLDNSGDLYGYHDTIHHYGLIAAGERAKYFRTVNYRNDFGDSGISEYMFFQPEAFSSFIESLNNCRLTISQDGVYTARFEIEEDGYLILPMERRAGWSVNGKPISSMEFLEGTLVIPVSSGETEVTLSYSPIWFILGLSLSLLFLACMIALAVMDKIRISASGKAVTFTARILQENYVYIVTFAIVTLVFLIMQCYSSSIPFGDNSTLIGDGYVQVYNGYRGIINDVKNGSFSAVNWNMGIAIDRYSDLVGYYSSPWGLLQLYFLPDSMVILDLTFGYFRSFLLPGLWLILYLTHRRRGQVMKKTDWRLILIGTGYSLSSYCISYFVYGNFSFLAEIPLILLGMERLIYDRKPALYIIILFQAMGSPYYAFILCEFIFLYFFTMEFESIKDMFLKGMRILLCSIASAGLACYRLIPYFFRTVDSPYKANDTISPMTKESGSYLSVFSNSMGFHQANVVSNNDFDANIYVGILVLFFVPLYLLNRKIPLNIRIRRIILVVLLFVGFGNSTLNYIFHGFHYQSEVPNRFAAFYVALLFIMFYDCLTSWKQYSGKTFALSIGGSFAVSVTLWTWGFFTDAGLSTAMNEESVQIAFYSTLVLAVIYLTLALLQLRKKHRDKLRKAMLGVCLTEMILSAFVTFQKAVGLSIPYTRDNDHINALAERNPDMQASFHATEYVGNPAYNTAEVTNTSSISAFSSMMSNAHMDLFHKWGFITSKNALFYLNGNPLADMMLHVNYHVTSEQEVFNSSPYPVIDHQGYMDLHENPYYLPVGIYIPDTEGIRAWDQTSYAGYEQGCIGYHNAFAQLLGCGPIYEEIDPELDEKKIEADKEEMLTYIYTDTEAYEAGTSNQATAFIHVGKDVEGDIYGSYFGTITYLGTTKLGEADDFEMTMYLPTQTDQGFHIRIATLNHTEMTKLHDKLSAYTMADASISGSSFSGTIVLPEDGMVFLSIPNMQEWTYTVDGSPVAPTSFLGAVGLSLSAGTHTIKVQFVPQNAQLGGLLSIATLVILMSVIIIMHLRKKAGKNRPSTAEAEAVPTEA